MKRCINCMETVPDEQTVCPHCGYDKETTEERFDQLKPGSLLNDRFTVGRPLGRGGFGITYIAWDNSLQRKVAIKEYLPKGMALRDQGNTTITYDSETKEAFLRGVEKTIEESRKLAGFSDLESVVNVYDCFRENGTAYIVMEVLKGENVKEKISREGPASFEETLRIMTPVLRTLGAVHKSGLIHRDISPDNIFICENGKIKLLDFGSARVADNSDERSRSIVLKHGYAPKEQYTSKGRQGPYTDIYAVCATIYKMLTGITPVDSLERIADEDELQDISELVKIPAPAAKAIMKGMAVNPSDRIQSAEELLTKLSEKEDKKASAYYDEEETVTLYVPKPATAVIPDEPVSAGEIAAAGGLNKPVSQSKAKAAPKPAKSDAPKSSGQKTSPEIIKIAVIAAAGLALVAGGVIALPKVLNKEKKTDDVSVYTSSTTATTIAQSIEKIITESTTALTAEKESETETKKETTAETTTEKTTAKKETAKSTTAKEKAEAVKNNKPATAYVITIDSSSPVNLRESADTKSKSLAKLKSGTEIKVYEKSGEWFKVSANNKTGYIRNDYLAFVKPSSDLSSLSKYGVTVTKSSDGKYSADRLLYNADYDDLLPAVSDNMRMYSGDIQDLLKLINKTRSDNGLKALELTEEMSTMAGIRAEEIAWSGKHSHTRPNLKEFTSIYFDYGYKTGLSGECISWYYKTYENVLSAWMSNNGNKDNILNEAFDTIGIGVAKEADPTRGFVYVLFLYGK